MSKVAVVTGGSSGIGLCTTIELKKSGYVVYEISRNGSDTEFARHITADVTDSIKISDVIKSVIDNEGHIDLLINNAGFGISGAVEFTSIEDAKRLIDVNFFGMVNTVKAALPYMRENKSGKIINISSIASIVPIPFQTFYSASKAAINSYTMSLANEVRHFNIEVCAVMPGDIKTGFTDARKKSELGDEVYKNRISRSVSTMEHDERNGMSPEAAAKYIVQVANSNNVKSLYAIGFKYKFFAVIANILPARLKNYIIYKLYAE